MFKKVLLVLCLVFSALPVRAETDYAHSKEWLKLLHYKKSPLGGYIGLVDSRDFYADENGRYNPENELETEIKLFNADDKIKCEFPARFEWLKEKKTS